MIHKLKYHYYPFLSVLHERKGKFFSSPLGNSPYHLCEGIILIPSHMLMVLDTLSLFHRVLNMHKICLLYLVKVGLENIDLVVCHTQKMCCWPVLISKKVLIWLLPKPTHKKCFRITYISCNWRFIIFKGTIIFKRCSYDSKRYGNRNLSK